MGQKFWSKIWWRKKVNTNTKEVFATIKRKPNKTKILVLKSEEGIIITKKDLEEIYYRFYKLYKAHR
jgi:signal transduction histidine kinase